MNSVAPSSSHACALRGQHVLSCAAFDPATIARLFELADLFAPVARGEAVCRVLEGAVLGNLFFEASTRTRLSFASAFLRLGGSVSTVVGERDTSLSKGETLTDMGRVLSGYCDVLVMRHPEEASIQTLATATRVPVINAGNGAGEHPTQALLDCYVLERELARRGKPLAHSRIALVGDLRYGRTVHSLLRLFAHTPGLRLHCIAPVGLELPEDLADFVRHSGLTLTCGTDLVEGVQGADVIYTTRIQHERAAALMDGESPAHVPKITRPQVNRTLLDAHCAPEVVVMHPLPRDQRAGSGDLSTDLDGDPRLAIFRQTDAGVPVRMALFAMVLDVENIVRTQAGSRGENWPQTAWYRPSPLRPIDCLPTAGL